MGIKKTIGKLDRRKVLSQRAHNLLGTVPWAGAGVCFHSVPCCRHLLAFSRGTYC